MRRILPLLGVIVAPLALVLGIYLGGHSNLLPNVLRDQLVDDGQARIYQDATDRIARDYYRPVDRSKLLDTSLGAAVQSLDDQFSHYFDPKTYRDFQESSAGQFEGVGMTVAQDPKGLKIVSVFKAGPAAKAGLKRGDLITAVNGKPLKGKTSVVATAMIKGKAGTAVRLEILSGGRTRTEEIRRAAVDIPIVSRMETLDGRKTAYVALDSFTSGAHAKVGEAVRRLLKQGAKGVVLDLRDNPGGLLEEAVLVSSIFVGDGTIVTTKGRSRPAHTFKATGQAIDKGIPVAVLVNGGSASASEIVSGALQDRGRAKIVGERTFGKGVFQEVEELPNGGALDITVGEYFTPKGRNLGPHGGKRGIEPDVPAVDKRSTPKVDEALQAALRTIAGA